MSEVLEKYLQMCDEANEFFETDEKNMILYQRKHLNIAKTTSLLKIGKDY